MDQDAQSAASDRPDPSTYLSRLIFFLPLGCYWLLAVLATFHPRPLWVVAMVGPLLVLMALAVVGKFEAVQLSGADLPPPNRLAPLRAVFPAPGGIGARDLLGFRSDKLPTQYFV
jgi:hypothetical protein